MFIENVQCNGSESSLADCPASEVRDHSCSHSEDAGVRCEGQKKTMTMTLISHLLIEGLPVSYPQLFVLKTEI